MYVLSRYVWIIKKIETVISASLMSDVPILCVLGHKFCTYMVGETGVNFNRGRKWVILEPSLGKVAKCLAEMCFIDRTINVL